jgi:type IV pilus assembly protein PilN
MLVEINLLPRRERVGIAYKAAAAALVICTVLGVIAIAVQLYLVKQDLAISRQELEQTKQLQAVEQKKLTQGNTGSAVKNLITAVQLTQLLPTSSVSILNYFVSLLPKRGFVLDYTYNGATVSTTVQFDSIYEASAYLNQLYQSPWVESASTNGISAGGSAKDANANGTAIAPGYTATFDIKLNLMAIWEEERKQP